MIYKHIIFIKLQNIGIKTFVGPVKTRVSWAGLPQPSNSPQEFFLRTRRSSWRASRSIFPREGLRARPSISAKDQDDRLGGLKRDLCLERASPRRSSGPGASPRHPREVSPREKSTAKEPRRGFMPRGVPSSGSKLLRRCRAHMGSAPAAE